MQVVVLSPAARLRCCLLLAAMPDEIKGEWVVVLVAVVVCWGSLID